MVPGDVEEDLNQIYEKNRFFSQIELAHLYLKKILSLGFTAYQPALLVQGPEADPVLGVDGRILMVFFHILSNKIESKLRRFGIIGTYLQRQDLRL